MSARAVTTDELGYLRQNGQSTRVYLAIIQPDVVFKARVDGTPATDDQVSTLPYYGRTYGLATDIHDGMTVLIGSTDGGYEYGMVRARSAAASGSLTGIITIGITSEIAWSDSAYITVLREYGLWPKTAIMAGSDMLCDDDQPYSDQNTNTAPVPVFGPDAALHLSGSSVSLPLSATSSWMPYQPPGDTGITIDGYTWGFEYASGSAAFHDSGSAIIFYSPGTYTLSCTVNTDVSGSAGPSTTGHRTVYVWNDAAPPETQFTLDSLQGDWRSGGWGFELTLYSGVDRALVHDRTKIILFTQSQYGPSAINLGPMTSYETTLAMGWVDGESLSINPELNTIKFSVHGPQWWLNKIASWPAGMRGHTDTTPTSWNEFKYLTYDAFMWHILRWRCTAAEVMDIYPSNVQTRMVGADAPWSTIWGQINQVADAKFMIHPCCNRYGQLYNQYNPNTARLTDRSSIPTVMNITKQDWGETLEVERRIVPEVGFMDITGVSWNGASAAPYRAGSWGTAVGRFGRMERRTELIVPETDAVAYLIELAGALLGSNNVEYPRISFRLAQFNPFFDIAPNQYGTFSIEASDTPLNYAVTDQYFVPRSIFYTWDPNSGAMITDIVAEGRANIIHGYQLPFYYGPDYQLPPPTPWTPWNPNYGPIRLPNPLIPCTALNAPPNGPYQLPVATQVYSGSPGLAWVQPYHSKLRDKDAIYPTVVSADCTYYLSSGSGTWEMTSGSAPLMKVTAFDEAGNDIITGVQRAYTGGATGTRIFDFSPNDPTEIYGFRFSGSAVPVSGSALTPIGLLEYSSYVGTYTPTDQFGQCDYSEPLPATSGGSYVPNGALYLNTQLSCPNSYNNITDNFYFLVNLPASPGTGHVVFDLEIFNPGDSNRDNNYTGINCAPSLLSGSALYTFSGSSFYGTHSMRVDGTPTGPGVLTTANPRAMIDWDLDWTASGSAPRWLGINFGSNYRIAQLVLQVYGIYWRTDIGDEPIWYLGAATTDSRSVITAARVANICRYFDP